MSPEELRALQAPLKQLYRDDPARALVPAQAVARIDQPGLAAQVENGPVAGLHPAAGGAGDLACSADLFLQALAACAGVTLAAVATAMGLTLRGARVQASSSWDARGTLAVDKTAPVGLGEITLTFTLDSDAEPATLARLLQSTERYCVILQTLAQPPRLRAVLAGG